MNERLSILGQDQMRALERNFMMQMIDMQWREHLMHLDHLRAVIGLRGYGQRDPLNEYKTEAFSLFEALLVNLRQNVTRWLMNVEIRFAEPEPLPEPRFQEIHLDPLSLENERQPALMDAGSGPKQAVFDPMGASAPQSAPSAAQPASIGATPHGWESTPRNAMCPCGSGKRFKHCHGALS